MSLKIVWFVNKLLQFAEKSSDSCLRRTAIEEVASHIKEQSNSNKYLEEDFIDLWKKIYATKFFESQHDVSEHISKLMHSFCTFEEKMIFVKSGICIISKSYKKNAPCLIINNYKQLVKNLVIQALVVVKNDGWKTEALQHYAHVLHKCIISPNDDSNKKPLCLKFFLTEQFISLLTEVTKGKINSANLQILLEPFVKVLVFSKQTPYIHHVQKNIFDKMLAEKEGKSKEKNGESVKAIKFPISKDWLALKLRNLGAVKVVDLTRRKLINSFLEKLGEKTMLPLVECTTEENPRENSKKMKKGKKRSLNDDTPKENIKKRKFWNKKKVVSNDQETVKNNDTKISETMSKKKRNGKRRPKEHESAEPTDQNIKKRKISYEKLSKAVLGNNENNALLKQAPAMNGTDIKSTKSKKKRKGKKRFVHDNSTVAKKENLGKPPALSNHSENNTTSQETVGMNGSKTKSRKRRGRSRYFDKISPISLQSNVDSKLDGVKSFTIKSKSLSLEKKIKIEAPSKKSNNSVIDKVVKEPAKPRKAKKPINSAASHQKIEISSPSKSIKKERKLQKLEESSDFTRKFNVKNIKKENGCN